MCPACNQWAPDGGNHLCYIQNEFRLARTRSPTGLPAPQGEPFTCDTVTLLCGLITSDTETRMPLKTFPLEVSPFSRSGSENRGPPLRRVRLAGTTIICWENWNLVVSLAPVADHLWCVRVSESFATRPVPTFFVPAYVEAGWSLRRQPGRTSARERVFPSSSH